MVVLAVKLYGFSHCALWVLNIRDVKPLYLHFAGPFHLCGQQWRQGAGLRLWSWGVKTQWNWRVVTLELDCRVTPWLRDPHLLEGWPEGGSGRNPASKGLSDRLAGWELTVSDFLTQFKKKFSSEVGFLDITLNRFVQQCSQERGSELSQEVLHEYRPMLLNTAP